MPVNGATLIPDTQQIHQCPHNWTWQGT